MFLTNHTCSRHVDQDLQPYVCLFPQCAAALVFFSRQQEWKEHMDSVHGDSWARNVHSTTFYCDIGHEEPIQFHEEDEWRRHMSDLEAHATRFKKPPSKTQLDALVLRKREVVERDVWVCPLCEDIPEDMKPLVSKFRPADLDNKLNKHIGQHVKALSLMSLPGGDEEPDEGDQESCIDEKESLKRLARTLSPQVPPSEPSGMDRLSCLNLIFQENEIPDADANDPPERIRNAHTLARGNRALNRLIDEKALADPPPDPLGMFSPSFANSMALEAVWADILNSKGNHSDARDPILEHFLIDSFLRKKVKISGNAGEGVGDETVNKETMGPRGVLTPSPEPPGIIPL